MRPSERTSFQETKAEHTEVKGRLIRSAWTATKQAMLGVSLLTLWFLFAHPVLKMAPYRSTGLVITFLLTLPAFYLLFKAVHEVGKPIDHAMRNGKTFLLFIVSFWVPFVLFFPLIGSLIGIWRWRVLKVGKFAASVVTVNGVSTSYDATELLHGEGNPAASLFLFMALAWPVLLLFAFAAIAA